MIKLCKLYRSFKKLKAREGIQRPTESPSMHVKMFIGWQSYTKVKQN